MKPEEVETLMRFRLEQARIALGDAQYLLEGNRSPASVVNRAYYAMFYTVLALLQKGGKVPSRHTGIIALFDKEYVMKSIFSRELSKDLHKAFELRQISDYKVVDSTSLEEAHEI
jgi:uncharacterized protein (UPF0332 family)